jgi:hypothetical protein
MKRLGSYLSVLVLLGIVSCVRNPPNTNSSPTPTASPSPAPANASPTLVPPDCPPEIPQTCTPGWPDANPWHANVVMAAVEVIKVQHPEWYNHEKTQVLPPFRQQYDFAMADEIRTHAIATLSKSPRVVRLPIMKSTHYSSAMVICAHRTWMASAHVVSRAAGRF